MSFFRHNFSVNDPQDLKIGPERRVSQFYTICDDNQHLNTNIEKVTAVLVVRSWDAVPLGQVVPPGSGTSWSLELYLEIPCSSRHKNELYRCVSKSAKICARN